MEPVQPCCRAVSEPDRNRFSRGNRSKSTRRNSRYSCLDMAKNPNELSEAIESLQAFAGADLTHTLAKIERSLQRVTAENYAAALTASGARGEVLGAASLGKRLAGQINVIVHALGILLCLPYILGRDDVIEYVSLGAGNTDRAFDVETSQRIAEFKFIRWQAGPESIRRNALVKDFCDMAEHPSLKEQFLYVLGTEHVERCFK